MAGRKHLRGASKREQRQYEHIKKSAQKSGRYGKRAKEVAARTVVKPSQKETTQKSQITKKLEFARKHQSHAAEPLQSAQY